MAARAQLLAVLAAFAGFAFLLHFVWEMLQSPLYTNLRGASHEEAVWICTRAALGDVGIGLAAYAAGALAQRDRVWIVHPRARGWLAYLLAGVATTLVLEYLGTGSLQRWTYDPNMLTLPLLGTGLSPLLQWLLVPPLGAWLTRRHSRHH